VCICFEFVAIQTGSRLKCCPADLAEGVALFDLMPISANLTTKFIIICSKSRHGFGRHIVHWSRGEKQASGLAGRMNGSIISDQLRLRLASLVFAGGSRRRCLSAAVIRFGHLRRSKA
jgi:hypothetical protein